MKLIQSADGCLVAQGDRVFNYYDRKWGVIAEAPDREGWFHVLQDDGSQALLNGERIALHDPKGGAA